MKSVCSDALGWEVIWTAIYHLVPSWIYST
jgi:hypothetical protein